MRTSLTFTKSPSRIAPQHRPAQASLPYSHKTSATNTHTFGRVTPRSVIQLITLLLGILTLSQCYTGSAARKASPFLDSQTEMMYRTSRAGLYPKIANLPVEEQIRMAEGRYHITLVDIFSPSAASKLNNLPQVKTSHGQDAQYIMEDAFPNSTLDRIEIDTNSDGHTSTREIHDALYRVHAHTDLVNLPYGPINTLPVSRIRTPRSGEISKKSLPLSQRMEHSYLIKALEQLASDINGWVVIPISNEPDAVSQYTFAHGVIVAGHTPPRIERMRDWKYPQISHHPLIETHQQPQGFFATIKVLPDSLRAIFDMHANGSIQDTVTLSEPLNPGSVHSGWKYGSSYSTPKVGILILWLQTQIAQQLLTEKGIPFIPAQRPPILEEMDTTH